MKYIKLYEENIIFKYKIGDYVIANLFGTNWEGDDFGEQEFLENNVGQVVYTKNNKYNRFNWYDVKYKNVPKKLEYNIQSILRDNKKGEGLPNIWSYEENEIRLATSEEIKTQKLKNEVYKYNL